MKRDLKIFTEIAGELEKKEREHLVLPSQSPEELKNVIDFSLNEKGESDEKFEENLKELVFNTPRTASKGFFNQLFGGRNSRALLGDLLSVLLNTGMHTYKVNGAQVLVENEIIKRVCELINYPKTSGGIFPPGGSMANFMALLMARDVYDPKARKEGVSKKMIAYTSDQAHYSMEKNMRFAGIGEDQLRKIQSDGQGKMDTLELEEAIIKDKDAGNLPFFVKVTAGTTVLGAYDDIKEIAKICQKYDIWLHVDGAYGGVTIFSEKHRHLMDDVQQANSFCFNAHKMLQVPLTCSVLVTQNEKHLHESFSNNADYLYQSGELNLNPGFRSLQCGRKNNALKFWTLWKSIGRQGLSEMVEKNFSLADVARAYVRKNKNYTLYSFDESTNICFNYKDYDPKKLCQKLHDEGQLMVGYGSFRGNTFIRLVTVNSNNEEEDVLNVFKIIESLF